MTLYTYIYIVRPVKSKKNTKKQNKEKQKSTKTKEKKTTTKPTNAKNFCTFGLATIKPPLPFLKHLKQVICIKILCPPYFQNRLVMEMIMTVIYLFIK